MGILDRFTSKKERELKGEAVDTTATPVTEKDVSVSGEAGSASGGKSAKKKAPAKAEKAADKKPAKLISERLSDVIVRPLVTEKAAVMASAGQYMFVVTNDANRVEIRDAVRALYGIVPTSVNIQRVRGKQVRFGQRIGSRVSWKKAIVTLPKGKTIDVYEGV